MSTKSTTNDGGFVIFSGDKPWYSANSNTTPKEKPVKSKTAVRTRASAKGKPQVVYPHFEACIPLTDDPFWKDLLMEASLGSFPRGFRYQDEILTHRIRHKTTGKEFPRTMSPVETFRQLRKFLGESGAIMSELDIAANKRQEEERISAMLSRRVTTWSDVKVQAQKSTLISLYSGALAKQYGLNHLQSKSVEEKIRMGVLAGYFSSENIRIVGGIIQSIDGLLYDPETGSFEIDIQKIKTKSKKPKRSNPEDEEENLNSKNKLLKSWEKTLGELYKRRVKPKLSSSHPSFESLHGMPSTPASTAGTPGVTPVSTPGFTPRTTGLSFRILSTPVRTPVPAFSFRILT